MDRTDWLLLFLSKRTLGHDEGPDALDPIRIQKGMFLLSRRGPARRLYAFRSYNWGPFSAQIYADLEALEERGLVRGDRVPGRSWRLFRVTPTGEAAAAEAAEAVSPDDVSWLRKARSFVTDRSFEKLLRDIYEEYPEFANRSLLR